jgi:pilus assembly protein Flp/PilA
MAHFHKCVDESNGPISDHVRAANAHPPEHDPEVIMITSIQFLTAWAEARFTNTDRGATMVEYALMIALVAVVAAVGAKTLGLDTNALFDNVGSKVKP